ncbi:sulfotransferase family protein [Georgenia deserti]|uniref:Sulfotransferase family protein n=1 Tax=Georgenia deserti TaxID=2093781 RepID=A0ABW4L166_9MICO
MSDEHSRCSNGSSAGLQCSPWGEHQLVFVGGLHRSGTTLLGQLIGGSDNGTSLSGTGVYMDEGQHLQDVYPTGLDLGGVSRWAQSPGAHLTHKDAQRTPQAAMRLWEAWSPHWDLSRRILVEKSPPNLVRTSYLRELFPGAKFVLIMRHPVSQALAVWKWEKRLLVRYGVTFNWLIEHWLDAHEAMREDIAGRDDILLLNYEHLMTSPRSEFLRLASFLGLQGGLDGVEAVRPETQSRYADLWARLERGGGRPEFGDGFGGSLRRNLTRVTMPVQGWLIRRLYADRVKSFGYDISRPTSPPAGMNAD